MSNTTAVMPDDLFRNLSEEEKEQFRAYAEANPPADANQYAISHPVCREVWDANGYGPPFGDIDPVTLVNGLHRVRRDVSNPVHDKRRSSSFRDLPVWPRGTVVYVDDDGSIFYQAGSDHPGMNGTVHSEAEGYQELVNALEVMPFTTGLTVPFLLGSNKDERDTACCAVLNALLESGEIEESRLHEIIASIMS